MLAPLAAAGSPTYIQLALVVTILVGVVQWCVGFLKLGSLANFISPSALFGFTSGAAVLIAVIVAIVAPAASTVPRRP